MLRQSWSTGRWAQTEAHWMSSGLNSPATKMCIENKNNIYCFYQLAQEKLTLVGFDGQLCELTSFVGDADAGGGWGWCLT